MDLRIFNEIVADAGARLMIDVQRGLLVRLRLDPGTLVALRDEPLPDVPQAFELVSQNEDRMHFRAPQPVVLVLDVLEAIEVVERVTRATDRDGCDARHIYFEGLDVVANQPGRYVTCWGS